MKGSEQVAVKTDWIVKSIGFILATCATFFLNQLNGSIASLTTQLKVMESHQVDTDKRVLAIEVSRESNMAQYQKLIGDVADLKTSVVQLTMRVQTIGDFVVKRIK